MRGCGHCWPAPLEQRAPSPARSPVTTAASRFNLPPSRDSQTWSPPRSPRSPKSPRKATIHIGANQPASEAQL